MRWLAPLKVLRGTALDPFGRTEERRTERQLVADYRQTPGTQLRGPAELRTTTRWRWNWHACPKTHQGVWPCEGSATCTGQPGLTWQALLAQWKQITPDTLAPEPLQSNK
jgi:indolepyruvate ferredoxin oxidoreductase